MADDPPLPDWLNDDLTHDKLLEQCYRRKADWLLPENGGVYCAGDKIRELKAGLTILRIASPTTPVLRDGLVEQLKGSAADNRKLFDDFHASLDLIVTAIKNVMPAAPSSEVKPVDDVAETIKRVALLLGEDGGKIMAIVSHPTYTTDQKLRALGVDERFKGYTSDILAKMLGVSPASIRNSSAWKEWNSKPTKCEKSAQK